MIKLNHIKVLWCCIVLLSLSLNTNADDVDDDIFIQIFVKKPINIVSDKYVSFSIDPAHLLELCVNPRFNETASLLATNIDSSYLKIAGPNTKYFTIKEEDDYDDEDSMEIQVNHFLLYQSDWLKIIQWMKMANLKPIITLPYKPNKWKPKNALSVLGITEENGLNDCSWQLGAEYNSTDVISYIDDLTTFRTIVDAFKKKNRWDVMGSDWTVDSTLDEANLYVELSKKLVSSYGWIQPSDATSIEINENIFTRTEPTLLRFLNAPVPVWLNIPIATAEHSEELCNEQCLINGLRWAQTLGIAAQTGSKVIFNRIDQNDFVNPSLSYYISLIHKKIMGNKVFDTKILNGNKATAQFFTHCTNDISGSFTVMGINFHNHKAKVSTKLATKYTGSEVRQYILSVENGVILLNGEPIDDDSLIVPSVKVKRPNKPTSFILQSYSIGFWSFPKSNLKQCMYQENSEETVSDTIVDAIEEATALSEVKPKTATELLLQELILENAKNTKRRNRLKRHAIVKKDSKHMQFRRDVFPENLEKRSKRQVMQPGGLGRIFRNFDLPKQSKKNSKNKKTKTSQVESMPKIQPTLQHDQYGVDSVERIFQSRENPDLPTGDIYLEIGQDKNPDYVEFDDQDYENFEVERSDIAPPSAVLPIIPNYEMQQRVQQAPRNPDQFLDFYSDPIDMPQRKPVSFSPYYNELWEADKYQQPSVYTNQNNYLQDDQPEKIKIVNEQPLSYEKPVEKSKISKDLPYRPNREYTRDSYRNLNEFDRPERKLKYPYIESEEDSYYKPRRNKRSIDQTMNDEIEKRIERLENQRFQMERDNVENVNEEPIIEESDNESFVEDVNNFNKLNLLEKLTKLLSRIDGLDELTNANNFRKINDEITDLEEFLFRKNSKTKFFNDRKCTKGICQLDLRKKCKLLSLNMEQQCIRENNDLFKNPTKREVPSCPKASGIRKKKSVGSPKKLERNRRFATWQTSWEDGEGPARNMIPIEYFGDAADKPAPHILFGKTVFLRDNDIVPKTSNKIDNEIETDINPKDEEKPIQVEVTAADGIGADLPIAPIENHKNGDDANGKSIEIDKVEPPKFMKTFSSHVETLMDVLNDHVTGWWHMLN